MQCSKNFFNRQDKLLALMSRKERRKSLDCNIVCRIASRTWRIKMEFHCRHKIFRCMKMIAKKLWSNLYYQNLPFAMFCEPASNFEKDSTYHFNNPINIIESCVAWMFVRVLSKGWTLTLKILKIKVKRVC